MSNRHPVFIGFAAVLILAASVSASPTKASGAPRPRASAQDAPWPGAAERMIDVGGYALFFRVIRGGEPVVLLEAGGTMDSTEWAGLAPRIARETGATVVAYDRAGFGRSDLPETPYDLPGEDAALRKALEALGLTRNLVLVGHSYGGFLIRYEAWKRPETVRGMVFVDPFTTEFVDMVGLETMEGMTGNVDGSHPERLTRKQRGELRFVGWPKNGLAERVAQARGAAVPKGVPAIILTSGRDFLPDPRIAGFWRESHRRLAATIPGSKIVVAADSDHMIPERKPDVVLSAILEVVRAAK